MSKNFEEEYKNLILTDIPDLWDRIEAGLPEQQTQPTATVNPEISNISYIDSATNSKRKKTFHAAKYSGWIAAVICLAIVIPAIVLGARTGIFNERTDNSESVTNQATDAEEMHNSGNRDYDVNVDSFEAEAAMEAVEPKEEEQVESEDAMVYEGVNSATTEVTEELQRERIISRIVVSIQSIVDENGVRYEAIVEEYQGDELSQGENILLQPAVGGEYEDILTTPELEPGESYELNIYQLPDGTYLILKLF